MEPRIPDMHLPGYDKKLTRSILYFLKFTLYFFIRRGHDYYHDRVYMFSLVFILRD